MSNVKQEALLTNQEAEKLMAKWRDVKQNRIQPEKKKKKKKKKRLKLLNHLKMI